MKTYKIILNPISGRGTGKRLVPQTINLLRSAGLDFDLVETERPGHAIELARQAACEGYQVVVAAGGDGTANEVLNGLMQAQAQGFRAVLGLLPVGRGNDFAYGVEALSTPITAPAEGRIQAQVRRMRMYASSVPLVGLSKEAAQKPTPAPKGLVEAVDALKKDHRKVIDVGRVTSDLYPDGRYFGNGVGIGFDAVVGFEALKLPPGLNGFLAYTLAALKTIFLFDQAPLMEIETDGQKFNRRCLMVSVMNGKRMGGGFMMAPKGQTGDGSFDLCIAGQVNRLGILGLIPRFMKGTQAGHPAIEFRQARQVKVAALEGALPAHADGETLCVEGQRVEMAIIPQALEVVVPGPEKEL